MNTSRMTRVILLVCIGVCVVWDVFVAWNPIPDDTISEMTAKFVMSNPTIPFLVGYICGHLFWAQKVKED